MDEKMHLINPEDINPRHNWGRALPSLGIMGVDFEERVDFRRLHRYRLGRAKQALEKSELGALLVFDVNNIRYLTSTKIGEWERDKLARWALLTRTGEPILWDFGSAAVHHKLYAPWLDSAELQGRPGRPARHRRARLRPDEEARRGTRLDPARKHGVADMPIGVDIIEPPMMFELQKAGLKVADGQQVMLEAREIKSQDEIALLNHAAGMVDGAYDLVNKELQARHARERHRRHGQRLPLSPRLRRRRSGQRGVGRARQSASAQLHRPHDPPRRHGLFRHPAGLRRLSHLLLPHLRRRPRDAAAARRLQAGARVAGQRDGCASSRAPRPRISPKPSRPAGEFGFPDEMSAFGLQFAHGLGLALHERPIISRVVSMDHPTEIKEGMVFAIETFCPATDGFSGARIEEEVVVTDKGCKVISLFPAEELPIANRY